ncbi:DUF2059 domain-containing protein [Massilia sp. CMS3.1]|uniref:DUF2059 domain-containing protein n=1 Tax=Massilia sp. CMS3.1 TaxID=3373083 RepID=UPI003EE4BFCD
MKRLVALFCTLAMSASALAQAPAALDPALAQSVRELLTAMKYREQLTARLQQTAQAMPEVILKAQAKRINANPKLTEEQKKAELAIVGNSTARVAQGGQRMLADPKLVDEILDRVVPMYASKFTQAEVNELLVFYKSPTAAKLLSLNPQLMQEANQLTQDMLRERLAAATAQALQAK